MDAPILLYNPNVDEFASRSLTIRNANDVERTFTFTEAASHHILRKKALQFYRNSFPAPMQLQLPAEFIQFVLRSLAVNERGCCHFEKKLPNEARKCLKGLIGRRDSDIEVKQIHRASTDKSSGFRGVFVKYFMKKVIYNSRNEAGRYEYAENFAAIFPFRVLQEVPDVVAESDVEVFNRFDKDFNSEIQTFLNDHFEDADWRKIGCLFLENVYHFRKTRFPQDALFDRVLRNSTNDKKSDTEEGDYLSSFPRFTEEGIDRYLELYSHYKSVRKIFDNVDVSTDKYDRNYFRTLPESNFADLYELLNVDLFKSRRKEYIELFKKYLFFFVHALKEPPNPVFFIDDVLFECLKCLHGFKTCREDLTIASDIAKLSLVQLRTKFQNEFDYESSMYRVEPEFLRVMKEYIRSIPNIEAVQIDVEYRTDYLHGWMLFRNSDTCYEMCCSKRERRKVDDFLNRILCSILVPDAERIKYVVIYNSFKGQESRLEMPRDVETIRNFVRLVNKYDFANDTQAESNDEFLTRDMETYFDHLTISN